MSKSEIKGIQELLSYHKEEGLYLKQRGGEDGSTYHAASFIHFRWVELLEKLLSDIRAREPAPGSGRAT